MTKKENELLFGLLSSFDAFKESDKEHKKSIKETLEKLNTKIENGQESDRLEFVFLREEIYGGDGKDGLRHRVQSLEKTRSLVAKLLGGITLGGGSLVAFKDKLVSLLERF